MKKHFVSWIAAVALVIGLVPVQAFAAVDDAGDAQAEEEVQYTAVLEEDEGAEAEDADEAADDEEAVDENVSATDESENVDEAEQESSDPEEEEPEAPEEENTQLVADGVYEIVANLSGSPRLDVTYASTSSGANVQVYESNGNLAQKWYISINPDGFYTITSMCSGLALDVANGGCLNGTNVQQCTQFGNTCQQWQIIENSNGTYSFVARRSGLALDVDGGSSANGTNVQTYQFNYSTAQQFYLVQTDPVTTGTYYIASQANKNMLLDVASASSSSGANVQLYQSNSNMAQRWYICSNGNGTYTIESLCSGKVLDVTNGNFANGTNIQQCTKFNNDCQQWVIQPNSDGSFTFLTVNGDYAIDIANNSTVNGTNIQLYSVNGQQAQKFCLSTASPLDAGDYTIGSFVNSNYVLDVADGAKTSGTNIQLYQANGLYAQCVRVSTDSAGRYIFTFPYTEMVIDVANGSATPGTNVWMCTNNGSNAQKWYVNYAGDLSYTITCVGTGTNLDVANGIAANGTNVQAYTPNGSNAQRFVFTATTYVPPEPASYTLMDSKASVMSSATSWLICVDTTNNILGIYRNYGSGWQRSDIWQVSTGANGASPKGIWSVGIKGYVFGSGYSCYYYTQWNGNYLFHSVLYNQGTFTIQDGRLGMNISHGCVRMDINNAKYIYDNVPYGSAVLVY